MEYLKSRSPPRAMPTQRFSSLKHFPTKQKYFTYQNFARASSAIKLYLDSNSKLSRGHLLIRLCVETHIMRGETKFPSCPICKWDIEINREELGLAFGECAVLRRHPASNVTIVDDSQNEDAFASDDGGWEEIVKLGFIRDESPEQISKDCGTSPIANISVTIHEQATSSISNEKGTTNLVQVNTTDQIDTNDTDKLQGLLQELSTPIKGETDEDSKEGSKDSMMQSLARL
ncbi:6887_t:CDS:2 [Acaulospora colombiana]|uniref:6887_t:CDS:1 n=1 Tax=Acaulospora colombiana TaxID=27376 RepID=A0ACA9L9F8_9GLOM|nr:6887_t:CDS:2 [Acaulospora colombiana]